MQRVHIDHDLRFIFVNDVDSVICLLKAYTMFDDQFTLEATPFYVVECIKDRLKMRSHLAKLDDPKMLFTCSVTLMYMVDIFSPCGALHSVARSILAHYGNSKYVELRARNDLPVLKTYVLFSTDVASVVTDYLDGSISGDQVRTSLDLSKERLLEMTAIVLANQERTTRFIFPIFNRTSSHWSLLVIYLKLNRTTFMFDINPIHYDSMRHVNMNLAQSVYEFSCNEILCALQKSSQPLSRLSPPPQRIENFKQMPQQPDGWSCGWHLFGCLMHVVSYTDSFDADDIGNLIADRRLSACSSRKMLAKFMQQALLYTRVASLEYSVRVRLDRIAPCKKIETPADTSDAEEERIKKKIRL